MRQLAHRCYAALRAPDLPGLSTAFLKAFFVVVPSLALVLRDVITLRTLGASNALEGTLACWTVVQFLANLALSAIVLVLTPKPQEADAPGTQATFAWTGLGLGLILWLTSTWWLQPFDLSSTAYLSAQAAAPWGLLLLTGMCASAVLRASSLARGQYAQTFLPTLLPPVCATVAVLEGYGALGYAAGTALGQGLEWLVRNIWTQGRSAPAGASWLPRQGPLLGRVVGLVPAILAGALIPVLATTLASRGGPGALINWTYGNRLVAMANLGFGSILNTWMLRHPHKLRRGLSLAITVGIVLASILALLSGVIAHTLYGHKLSTSAMAQLVTAQAWELLTLPGLLMIGAINNALAGHSNHRLMRRLSLLGVLPLLAGFAAFSHPSLQTVVGLLLLCQMTGLAVATRGLRHAV